LQSPVQRPPILVRAPQNRTVGLERLRLQDDRRRSQVREPTRAALQDDDRRGRHRYAGSLTRSRCVGLVIRDPRRIGGWRRHPNDQQANAIQDSGRLAGQPQCKVAGLRGGIHTHAGCSPPATAITEFVARDRRGRSTFQASPARARMSCAPHAATELRIRCAAWQRMRRELASCGMAHRLQRPTALGGTMARVTNRPPLAPKGATGLLGAQLARLARVRCGRAPSFSEVSTASRS
jgi:hypothetical protein